MYLIDKYPKRLDVSNPGTLRMSKSVATKVMVEFEADESELGVKVAGSGGEKGISEGENIISEGVNVGSEDENYQEN